MADTTPSQNQSYVSNDGRKSTFGRSLVNYIQNRLPYASTENDSLNPKYKIFRNTGMRRADALAKTSVSSSNVLGVVLLGAIAG